MLNQSPNSLNKPVSARKLTLLIIMLILVLGIAVVAIQYFAAKKEISSLRSEISAQKNEEKVLDFTKLFISDVLKAEKEIDFETRLKLESAVRGINDAEILADWQKFTESKTEAEAQSNVKNLLETLVSKIQS